MQELGPCVLEGSHVRLEPLRSVHSDSLLSAAQTSDWSWLYADARTEVAMEQWIEEALEHEKAGTEYPFVVYSKNLQSIVGSTRYLDVRQRHRGVEIGSTWYSSRVWGTVVNPECKYLLMRHAFEDWSAVRVQLKTDEKNVHSQKAIQKLGAKFEGRLRNHRVRRDGTVGDSMMYSITIEEWKGEIEKALRHRVETSSPPR